MKYMVKHMTQFRFNFFFYIIFDQYNEITLKGKIKILDKDRNQNDPIKRKFTTLIGDDGNSDPESEPSTAKKTC